MSETISGRLSTLGHVMPQPSTPAANYIPWVRTGNQVFVSGQVPLKEGRAAYMGKVGADLDMETGQKAAQLCALNILAHLASAVEDDLSRVVRCVRLGGFVNAAPDFDQHPKVLNGASDLMVEVFGENGKHTRAAVGVASLPRGAAVEVDAVFEIL